MCAEIGTMASFVVLTLACAGAVMLLVSGFQHLPNHRVLLASMLAHDLLPYRVSRATARALPVTQLFVGTVALIGFVTTPVLGTQNSRWASAACCALYLAMSVYVAVVLARGDAADCACFGRSESMTWLSLMRTAVPAASFGWIVAQPLVISNGLLVLAAIAGIMIASLAISARRPGTHEEAGVDLPRSGGHGV